MTYETGTLTGSRAVATATVDGRAVAVVGNGDRLVLWDLLTRTPVDRYIATDASAARGSLAVGTLADDRPVVVAGYVDLGVWDLATGAKLAGPLSGHENTVESIATLKSPESPPIAASGSRDGTVRIWDLLPARPVADREPPLLGAVEKVAAGRLANGRGIALSCERSQVLVRDHDRGSPVRALLGGHDSPIMAVATATLPDGRAVAVGGGWDGTVRAWDLATGDQLIGGFAGHRRPVVAVETVPIGGEVLAAVTGSWDGTVGVWDIGTGAAIGAPLEGHDSVSTVAVVARPGNAAFIVSGGEDQRVVVWDLRTGSVVRHWDCPAPISAVAIVRSSDGRRTVVAGDQDGVIHRHDLYSGMPVGRRWTAHKGAVTAIVASRSDHGRTVIYTAGDSAVSPWDVDSAEPIGSTLPFPWPVRSLATARRRRARLVVGGVGIAVVEPKHGA
jgi:WD40 repeat protein